MEKSILSRQLMIGSTTPYASLWLITSLFWEANHTKNKRVGISPYPSGLFLVLFFFFMIM